jgi:hypothetical protein
MRKLSLGFVGVIALWGVTATCVRADDLADPYLGVELMLGFAGDMDVGTDAVNVGGIGGVNVSAEGSTDFSPEVGIGGGVIYMHPLMQYFALGGRLAVQSWRSNSDTSTGRNVAFELAAVPQLRLPLTAACELYLSVPVGITLDLLNEFDQSASVSVAGVTAGGSIEADAGVGWNVAGLFGVRFAVSSGFGLFAELGYAFHQASHDVRVQAGLTGAEAEGSAKFDVTWSQLALDLGAYF